MSLQKTKVFAVCVAEAAWTRIEAAAATIAATRMDRLSIGWFLSAGVMTLSCGSVAAGVLLRGSGGWSVPSARPARRRYEPHRGSHDARRPAAVRSCDRDARGRVATLPARVRAQGELRLVLLH